jgi:hypothetical protein
MSSRLIRSIEVVVDRATRSVRFSRGADGHVIVTASPDFRPLEDFLASDIGDSEADLRLVVERARGDAREPWGFGGNSCHVTVGPDDVLVENDFTGQQVTLSREEFVKILDDYARAVGDL